MIDYGYDNPIKRSEELRKARLHTLRKQGATVIQSVDSYGHIVTHDPETGETLEVSMGRILGNIISQPIGPKYNTDDVERMRTICLLEFGWNLDDKTDEEVRKGYAKTIRYLRKKRKESLEYTISMSEYHRKGSLTKLFIKAEEKFRKRPLSDQEKNELVNAHKKKILCSVIRNYSVSTWSYLVSTWNYWERINEMKF